MKSLVVKKTVKDGPEKVIEDKIREMLTLKGWFVVKTHGSQFQSGLPDLYATHSRYGARWIEVKNPDSFSFTPAQMETFPKLIANGTQVWVLTAGTEEEYEKLFKPHNYWQFLSVFTSAKQLC